MDSSVVFRKKGAKVEDDFFHTVLPRILSDSMITGVPEIVAADNILKKLIRVAVFVACLVGFIYQSLEFMEIYWRYETVVDVKVASDRGTEIPAFTVCNYIGVLASKVCSQPKYQNKCHLLQQHPEQTDASMDFCDCFPKRWCIDDILQNYSFPERRVYDEISLLENKDIIEYYLHTEEQFLSSCRLAYVDEGDYNEDCNKLPSLQIRCPHSETSIVNFCYTVNSLIGKPLMKPHSTTSTATFTLDLNPIRSNYPWFIPAVKAQIAIHNPREVVNPYDQGYTIPDGTRQDIRIKKVVKRLLPPPYDTQCVDYVKSWYERGGHGPLNNKECMQECQRNISLKEFGCLPELFFLVPGNEERCDPSKIVTAQMKNKINDCEARYCGSACYEEVYEVVRDQSIIAGKECIQTGENQDGMSVNIYLDGMEITTYTYSPKYDSIEIFSNLGGYVGMWLGISLIAVFDFLESLTVMMKFAYRKKQEAKKIQDEFNLRKTEKWKEIRKAHTQESLKRTRHARGKGQT